MVKCPPYLVCGEKKVAPLFTYEHYLQREVFSLLFFLNACELNIYSVLVELKSYSLLLNYKYTARSFHS
jgi:hypothetical protein